MEESAYCYACGNGMSVACCIFHTRFECVCGVTFTSVSEGSNLQGKLDRGRQRHYEDLMKAVDQEENAMKAASTLEQKTFHEDALSKARARLEEFRREEKARIEGLMSPGYAQEEAASRTPFGMSVWS